MDKYYTMKLIELLHEGRLKNLQIDREYNAANPAPPQFAVMVNGKIWKRDGKPVPFKDYATALKAADRITAARNVTTQVIPLKK